MGSKMAPSIACLYVSQFESKFLYPSEYWKFFLFWKRYIDDVLAVWIGTSEDLICFCEWLNSCDSNLQFTMTMDSHQVAFLDISITLINGQFKTSIFRKPTDRNNLLQYDSFHPKHLRNNIPTGQFLRLRRLCSTVEEYVSKADELKHRFFVRGYPLSVLKKAYKRGLYANRLLLLQPQQKTDVSPLVCVLPYSIHAFQIKKIIKQHWPILQYHEVFQDVPRFAFSKPLNLKQQLTHSQFLSSAASNYISGQHLPCGHCKYCQFSVTIQQMSLPSRRKYTQHATNCESHHIIYAISCPCQLIYVGNTTRSLKYRIGEHMSRIRTAVQEAPLVQHWQMTHHAITDLRFTVLDYHSNVRGGDIARVLWRKEQKWIYDLNTLHPNGLNNEIEWAAFL
uniref:Uncharacterized protein LOC117363075 n=1 Tax=Geotrypetes seraphini TaxID=260995 RepID=A0A6P8RLJ8_GEOSA|nr:uncharacterized protein LOC117363075 [Geotrypetes seraphini]